MNPINLIQNYRENYSVKYVPRNLRTEVFKFNLKRKITDKELGSVLDKRIEVLKAETEMWKEKTAIAKREIELIKIEERIAKYELEHPEWKAEADRKETYARLKKLEASNAN